MIEGKKKQQKNNNTHIKMETVELKEKQFIEKKEEAEKNLSAENLYQGARRGRFERKKTQLAEFKINTGQIAHIKQLQLMTEKFL